MIQHIKYFNEHTAYNNYINSSTAILPNMSFCQDSEHIHLKSYVETKITAKFYIPAQPLLNTSINVMNNDASLYFSEIEINGVVQENVQTQYKLTQQTNIIKYTLVNDSSTLGSNAFKNCSYLNEIFIPESIKNIDERAFYQCSMLNSVTLPDDLKSIGNYAFYNCTLINLTLPKNLKTLGQYTFYNNNFNSITIPDNVEIIPVHCFDKCSLLQSINFGSGVNTISNNAFCDCNNLNYLFIPKNVIAINSQAFLDCKSLQQIIIKSTTLSIGSVAFGCSNISESVLQSISCYATTAPTIENLPQAPKTFDGIASNGVLYVPYGSTGYDTWMSQLENNGWSISEQL